MQGFGTSVRARESGRLLVGRALGVRGYPVFAIYPEAGLRVAAWPILGMFF